MEIPKYMCWSIWLCRNQAIFQNQRHNSETAVIKGMTLLFEVVSSWGFDASKMNEMTSFEKDWLKISNTNLKAPLLKSYDPSSFYTRLKGDEFIEWQRKVGNSQLYFDGASKSNPGEARPGGVIVNLEEKTKVKYTWGLGIATNNQAEALSLWQGFENQFG